MNHFAFIPFSILVLYPLACGAQPSFDCTKAGNDTEKAICGSNTLSKLDMRLSQAFKDARSRASRATVSKILSDQKSWLNERDDCGSNEKCIAAQMRNRIAQLEPDGTGRAVPVGVYCNRGGAEYLVVSKDGPGMRVMVGSVGPTGDSCGTDDMAAAEKDGGLVARESGCTLSVFSRGGSIIASAAPPRVCHDQFCGVHADLGEFVFDQAARRPLTSTPDDVDIGKVCE